VAIGNGEVIAYRINENYIEDGAKVMGNETDKQFSTGFVLIRHSFEFPQGSGKHITFFSPLHASPAVELIQRQGKKAQTRLFQHHPLLCQQRA
jgi:hypothetical protein